MERGGEGKSLFKREGGWTRNKRGSHLAFHERFTSLLPDLICNRTAGRRSRREKEEGFDGKRQDNPLPSFSVTGGFSGGKKGRKGRESPSRKGGRRSASLFLSLFFSSEGREEGKGKRKEGRPVRKEGGRGGGGRKMIARLTPPSINPVYLFRTGVVYERGGERGETNRGKGEKRTG